MTEHVCFVIWPPALKYASKIIEEVKKKFELMHYSIYEFSEDFTWMEIINIIYVEPLEAHTAKRYKKSEGLDKYKKKIGIIEFNVTDVKYDDKNKKKVLIPVHQLKYHFRDNECKDIYRWHVLHSTESNKHTKILLDNLNKYCNKKERI